MEVLGSIVRDRNGTFLLLNDARLEACDVVDVAFAFRGGLDRAEEGVRDWAGMRAGDGDGDGEAEDAREEVSSSSCPSSFFPLLRFRRRGEREARRGEFFEGGESAVDMVGVL